MIDETDEDFLIWLESNQDDIVERWAETLDTDNIPEQMIEHYLEDCPPSTTSEDLSEGTLERLFERWLEDVDINDVPDKFIDKEYELWCKEERK